MNKEVKKYLENLDLSNTDIRNGVISASGRNNNIQYLGSKRVLGSRGVLYEYLINGERYYAKTMRDSSPSLEAKCEVILGEVLNDIGVHAVKARFFRRENGELCVLTKDVKNIPGIQADVITSIKEMDFTRYISCRKSGLFKMLEYSDIKRHLATFINPKGRRELFNGSSAGLLLGNQDMHDENIFLYKDNVEDDKYGGAIFIDNELTGFTNVWGAMYLNGEDLYDKFMSMPIRYFTATGCCSKEMTYPKLVGEFNQNIQAGLFDKQHIDFLKKVKNYDLTKKIEEIQDDTDINMGALYEAYSRLWDYLYVNLEL